MILRLLGWQGIAGLVVSGALALLLLVQKGETRHWRRQSDHFGQLYRTSEAAHVATVANYRAAAERARAADQANAARVAAAQRAITERTADDYQSRLAAARARADRLRRPAPLAAADPRARGSAPVPGMAAATGRSDAPAGKDRLFQPDALTATEQAIQLDELIKWIARQHAVDPNGGPARH